MFQLNRNTSTSFTNERLAWRNTGVPSSSSLNRSGDAKVLNTPANWATETTSVSLRNSSTRVLRSLELAFRYKSNASKGLLPKADFAIGAVILISIVGSKL